MIRRFAQLDSENIVQQVIVANSAEWCSANFGGVWIETFKDSSQRFHYAGIGYTYDADRDAFIPPKPFEFWVLNEDTCLWEPPIPYPNDGGVYEWDESFGDWVEVV